MTKGNMVTKIIMVLSTKMIPNGKHNYIISLTVVQWLSSIYKIWDKNQSFPWYKIIHCLETLAFSPTCFPTDSLPILTLVTLTTYVLMYLPSMQFYNSVPLHTLALYPSWTALLVLTWHVLQDEALEPPREWALL